VQASQRAAAARDSRETVRGIETERQRENSREIRQTEFETDRDEIVLHFYNIDPGYLQNSV